MVKIKQRLFGIIFLFALLILMGLCLADNYGSGNYGSGNYGTGGGATGAATGVHGYANVTVLSTTDIEMIRDTVNFTNTNPGDTRVSTIAADVDDGPICDPYCGLMISNNGSTEINITLTNEERLFDSPNYNAAAHYLYNVSHYGGLGYNDPLGDGSGTVCSSGNVGGNPTTSCDGTWWCPMPNEGSMHHTAICALNHTNGWDMVEVELNITIPLDEPAGQKDATIRFTAITWRP